MTTVDQIHKKAELPDPLRLQELADFLDFLLAKKSPKPDEQVFPMTQLESSDQTSVYHGRPLSLEEMDKAVEWEAGQRR